LIQISLTHSRNVFVLCRVGIGLDAYMMPVEDGIEDKVEQPLLFINTWTWQWPENIIKMKRLVDVDSPIDSEQTLTNAWLTIAFVYNRIPHSSVNNTSVCKCVVYTDLI